MNTIYDLVTFFNVQRILFLSTEQLTFSKKRLDDIQLQNSRYKKKYHTITFVYRRINELSHYFDTNNTFTVKIVYQRTNSFVH